MGNLKKLRVVDPHATQLVSGFRTPLTPVVNKIFKIVDVTSEAGKFMQFGAYAHLIRQGLERALGDDRKRISIQVGSGSYNTNEVSLEGGIPDRALRNVPEARRQDVRDQFVETIETAHLLGMEYAAATIIKDDTLYDASMTTALAGGQVWSDTVNSTPIANLRTWLRLVSRRTLTPLSELSVGLAPKPFEALIDHPDVRNRLQYVGREADGPSIAGILRCKEVFELSGMYVDDVDPENVTDVQGLDIFDDEVVVFHEVTDPSPASPLAGGIARVEGYPIVTEYRDEPRSSDVYAIDENYGVFLAQSTITRMFLGRNVSGN